MRPTQLKRTHSLPETTLFISELINKSLAAADNETGQLVILS